MKQNTNFGPTFFFKCGVGRQRGSQRGGEGEWGFHTPLFQRGKLSLSPIHGIRAQRPSLYDTIPLWEKSMGKPPFELHLHSQFYAPICMGGRPWKKCDGKQVPARGGVNEEVGVN